MVYMQLFDVKIMLLSFLNSIDIDIIYTVHIQYDINNFSRWTQLITAYNIIIVWFKQDINRIMLQYMYMHAQCTPVELKPVSHTHCNNNILSGNILKFSHLFENVIKNIINIEIYYYNYLFRKVWGHLKCGTLWVWRLEKDGKIKLEGQGKEWTGFWT